MFGPEYIKIQTVFKRTERGVIVPGEWSLPEFGYLADLQWTWTEKVDGTNIRLHWDGSRVTIGGRTDNAQVPAKLTAALAAYVDPVIWRTVFDEGGDVTVYGEGYGPGIQKGGNYRDDQMVVIFDVKVGDWWLRREDVQDVADKLGLEVVPPAGAATLTDTVGTVRQVAEGDGIFRSLLASRHEKTFDRAEGLVGRPVVDLFDRRGDRIVTKIKVKDFADLARRR